MKSTWYRIETVCSSWFCHIRSLVMCIFLSAVCCFPSTCSYLYTIFSVVPVQNLGCLFSELDQGGDPPSQRLREGENTYFSSESFSQPRLLQRPTAHVTCNGAAVWERGKWLCGIRIGLLMHTGLWITIVLPYLHTVLHWDMYSDEQGRRYNDPCQNVTVLN